MIKLNKEQWIDIITQQSKSELNAREFCAQLDNQFDKHRSLKGALQGAFSGALFGVIGASGLSGIESFAASGLAGGVISDLQGGKFGHGFVSAGIGAAMGGRFGKNPFAQVIGSAVVGGTVSKLTGGKFANGAMSAAFATALRADWKSDPVPKNCTVAFVVSVRPLHPVS